MTNELFEMTIDLTWEKDGIHDKSYLCSKFSDDDGANEKVSQVCKKYVERWDDMKSNGIGILLYGNVGTGKSFYASCICNELLKRQTTLCATSFTRILNVLQVEKNKIEVLDRLNKYQCIFLDDFGVERETGYAQEQVFSIIDARYRTKLPTIVTTNLSLPNIENPQGMIQSRICDRLLELCPIRICVSGDSRRKKNSMDRMKLARKLLE